MRQLRRIEVAAPANAWQKASRALLRHVAMSEAEFLALERKRPALVVVDAEAVLIGRPRAGEIDLQYGFSEHDAFARQFPSMLRRVLDHIDAQEAPLGILLRLTDRAPRPYVEPVLWANAFEQSREWWRMTLDPLPDPATGSGQAPAATGDEIADGFLLRPARAEDAEVIAKLDSLSFAQPWLTPSAARELVAQAPVLRVLEKIGTGGVGFLGLRIEEAGLGYVADLAIHPNERRRGLGERLMRSALAWFREQGLGSAALQVNTDNAPAIALYRKLGFEATDIGIDYRRPVDEEEARQVLEKRRAQHITVRRRY